MASQQLAKYVNGNVQVVTGNGRLFNSASLSPAAAAATLTVYDGIDNTGPVIGKLVSSANGITAVTPDLNINVSKGIYVEITGVGADAMIYYQ